MITAEQFEAAVGQPPKDDDLERCNCPKAGQHRHMNCGWNHEKRLPVFMAGAEKGEQVSQKSGLSGV